MYHLHNENFSVRFHANGQMKELTLHADPTKMNWVIDEKYLQEHSYPDDNKLFGCFQMKINGHVYESIDHTPTIHLMKSRLKVTYAFGNFSVVFVYSIEDEKNFTWSITLTNQSKVSLSVDNFILWFSPAYIMYRDENVKRNMDHSCAVFTHLSDDYTKIATVKRNNQGPHVGIYQTKGRTISVGSYCRYQNRFREQVSPSLDGAIFHNFILAGSEAFQEVQNHDWVYNHLYNDQMILNRGDSYCWEYELTPFLHQRDFLLNGLSKSHPIIDYSPVIVEGGIFEAQINLPEDQQIKNAYIVRQTSNGFEKKDVMDQLNRTSHQQMILHLQVNKPGKRKLIIEMENQTKDFVVFNVMEPIREILKSRIHYLCEHSYIDNANDKNAFGFQPISNQGESLGKLSFVLMNNLISTKNIEQIRKVETSAVFYIKNKWFVKGNFNQPKNIHGKFYRIMDFDYIAHVYYLLSRLELNELHYNEPKTYLKWAAEILMMRFDEDAHQEMRAKRESKMNGVFNIYILELLEALQEEGLEHEYTILSGLLDKFFNHLVNQSTSYYSAMTEHYYDNAGFGPTTESLCISGHIKEAQQYGELILANVGFSNDFRNQNPDRWWEALSYMIHSLWGGLVSYSALVAYEHFQEKEYLHAAYRSMMAVLYCYDWHETSGLTTIDKGEAASTYCVSSPNMNNPSLSRSRFGQSVFLKEDEELFKGNATGDDWDMGQELVAYLHGFGTKTYLYLQDEELKCVNGYVQKDNDRYTVYSFAAYPKQYISEELGLFATCEPNKMMPKIILRRNIAGKFECIKKEEITSS